MTGPSPAYPRRPPYFAHRYVRMLTKTCAANEIGHVAFVLCVVIAHIEDAKRYSGPVSFYTAQLMALIGVTKWESLDIARRKAIAAGWLHYEHRGQRGAGHYWVTLPAAADSLDDSPCDETSQELHPPTGNNGHLLSPANGDKGGYKGGDNAGDNEVDKGGDASTLSLNPSPIPKETAAKAARRTCRFDPTDRETAIWMLSLVRQVDDRFKEPNLDRWANDIRLMRSRTAPPTPRSAACSRGPMQTTSGRRTFSALTSFKPNSPPS